MAWIPTNVLDSSTSSTRRVTRRRSVAILSALITALCLLPSAARGEETLRVVIHESANIPGPQMAGALVLATTLFKAIDVRLEWHKGHLLFGEEHASTGLMASRIHPGSSFEDPFPGDERPELRAALQFDLAAMADSPVCDR